MGCNPHANGGLLLRDLRMPDFRDYAQKVPAPGSPGPGDMHVLGPFIRDVAKLNDAAKAKLIAAHTKTVPGARVFLANFKEEE